MKLCEWDACGPVAVEGARFASKRCRQSAFRLRKRAGAIAATSSAGRFAYADPPYPGKSYRYYKNEPTYAGEVDHRALIAELEAGGYMGWALSTSEEALADILAMCPRSPRGEILVHVCPWVKPIGASTNTFGIHNTWEPVIVRGGRQERPGKRDWLRAMPARGEGTLPGRKPTTFCAWLFSLLGMRAGDELVDMFPGTGIVTRAWEELGRASAGGRIASLFPGRDEVSSIPGFDDGASLLQHDDGPEKPEV